MEVFCGETAEELLDLVLLHQFEQESASLAVAQQEEQSLGAALVERVEEPPVLVQVEAARQVVECDLDAAEQSLGLLLGEGAEELLGRTGVQPEEESPDLMNLQLVENCLGFFDVHHAAEGEDFQEAFEHSVSFFECILVDLVDQLQYLFLFHLTSPLLLCPRLSAWAG